MTISPGNTALIGINNSGKSSALRFFYEFRGLFAVLSGISGPQIARFFESAEATAWGVASSVLDVQEMFSEIGDDDLRVMVDGLSSLPGNHGATVIDTLKLRIPRNTNTFRIEQLGLSPGLPITNIRSGPDIGHMLSPDLNDIPISVGPINMLGLHLSRTLYIPAFRNIINIGTNEDYFDLRVGQAFVERWRAIKTGNVRRELRDAIAVAAEIQAVFGFSVFDIDASNDGRTLQVTIDGNPYKLNEVGAGIAQFILILTNLLARSPVSLVLIDEPELNLHPRLQTQLMTLLAQRAEWGTVFATHNIGLARSEADRIYSFVLESPGVTRVRPYEETPRLAELVGELSFAGYRDIGFEGLLLVEGRTDIQIFRELLKQYDAESKVLILSLGGSDMIGRHSEEELLELTRITDRIWAVIDSERATESAPLAPERSAFAKACADAKIECHVLDLRASDNYLSDAAIKEVKGDKYRALAPFERLRDVDPAWAKSEAWKIARQMTKADLANTDLGRFLEQLASAL